MKAAIYISLSTQQEFLTDFNARLLIFTTNFKFIYNLVLIYNATISP
jgi:hypothetical protein